MLLLLHHLASCLFLFRFVCASSSEQCFCRISRKKSPFVFFFMGKTGSSNQENRIRPSLHRLSFFSLPESTPLSVVLFRSLSLFLPVPDAVQENKSFRTEWRRMARHSNGADYHRYATPAAKFGSLSNPRWLSLLFFFFQFLNCIVRVPPRNRAHSGQHFTRSRIVNRSLRHFVTPAGLMVFFSWLFFQFYAKP